MDTKSLVTTEEIALGKAATEILSADADLKVRAAMWVFDESRQQWLFTISTPFYERHGAQAAYLRVRKNLEKNDLLDRLPLERVSVISDSHPVLSAVRLVFGSPAELHIINCMVNGTELPSMYIYHVDKRRAGVRKAVQK